jgi:hypothetical protein
LDAAAASFDALAERLAGDVAALSALGVHSGAGPLVYTGTRDLDALIPGARDLFALVPDAGDLDGLITDTVDRIIRSLAGAGERLQDTARSLAQTAHNYRAMDAIAAEGMGSIYRSGGTDAIGGGPGSTPHHR